MKHSSSRCATNSTPARPNPANSCKTTPISAGALVGRRHLGMPLSFGCQPIQQITVQQNSILAIMNVITQHHIDTDDLAGMDAALEPHTRRLKTLGAYEQRRRRAAKETLAEFNKVEQEHHDAQQEHLQAAAETHQAFQKLGQTWDPKDWPSNKRAF